MSRKNTPKIIINDNEKYRNELLAMRIDYHNAQNEIINPENSKLKTNRISQYIKEQIEEILYHFKEAKKQNKLPQEYKYQN